MPQAPDQDRALGAYDLGADVVAVQALHVRLDISNSPTGEAQVHRAGHDVPEFRNLGPDRDRSKGVDLGNLIMGQPAGQIEVVNGAVVKEHAVDLRLVRPEWRHLLVASEGFEDHGLANLSRFDPLAGGKVSGVISAHEAHLQPDPGICHRAQRRLGALAAQAERLLAKNVLACAGCRLHRIGMELVRGRDQNRLDVFVFEHCLQAGIGVLNLKLFGHFGGAGSIHIGHGHQLCLGNPATQILRVALAHVPDSQHSDTQLTHPLCSHVKILPGAASGLARPIAPCIIGNISA